MRVVITGASRGIGAGLADAYRKTGAEVLGTARDGSAQVQMDVSDPAPLIAAIGENPVDLLVCNAGVYLDKGDTLETGYQADKWARTFEVNVTGVFLTIQALLPALRRAQGARVAVISSQMASTHQAPGGSYIYRASKAAALNLGRNLATDLKPEGIAVGIYHPGWVRTDMGGGSASISVEQSVSGLTERFAALNIETTGCFETWDGRPHPM